MIKSLNARETVAILDKMWASTEDIKKLGCIGNNKAYKIKREIRNQMVDDGMVFPRYLVGMEYVIKYFNIDEKKIRNIAKAGATNG